MKNLKNVKFAGRERTVVYYFGKDVEFTCLPANGIDYKNYEICDNLLINANINLRQSYIKHLYKVPWGDFFIFEEKYNKYDYIFRERDLNVFIENLKRYPN